MAGSGINGLSVGVITVGGLLVYAGIRGVTPLQALRDVSSGKPVPIPNTPGSVAGGEVAGGNVAQDLQGMTGTTGIAAVLTAANAFNGDRYSQGNRTQPGYSDCSSYVDKAFHAVGIAKPDGRMAWPNTSAFAISPVWKTIPQASAMPGDIAVVSGHHMVFVTTPGATQGIGQQNPHTNVRTGTMATLFTSVPGRVVFRRYVGPDPLVTVRSGVGGRNK